MCPFRPEVIERVNCSPLGRGLLAGVSFNIDHAAMEEKMNRLQVGLGIGGLTSRFGILEHDPGARSLNFKSLRFKK
ncbi:hypothetical protein BELL_0968g00020 [Botrytis elliptica]|uniref:Uncharacterized protein n=1 Tax=Botrytis elliptica TaxID=278938 RepID=A0A4Z1IY78_9HELO|nr:hypothetical protein BELL_0968g00020 [Botrytis elliptica]